MQAGIDIRIGNTGISEFYEHDFIALGPQVEMVESEPHHDKGMYFYLGYLLVLHYVRLNSSRVFMSEPMVMGH